MGTAVRGKRGTEGKARIVFRFRVGATFRDKARAVEHWMKEKRDATPFPSDEEITSYPRQDGVPYGSGRDIPGNRLPEDRLSCQHPRALCRQSGYRPCRRLRHGRKKAASQTYPVTQNRGNRSRST